MRIKIIEKVTDDFIQALENLMPQLNEAIVVPERSYLEEVIKSPNTHIVVATEHNKIIGTLTITTFAIASNRNIWVDDVVVDVNARGKGVGEQLIKFAITFAKTNGYSCINLTSGIKRTNAHKLYQKMGFEKRKTHVYRYTIT